MHPNKILILALRNPSGLRFHELVKLAEAFGFFINRTRGSHVMMRHLKIGDKLNIQDEKGMAKPYQVNQLLKLVEKHSLKLPE